MLPGQMPVSLRLPDRCRVNITQPHGGNPQGCRQGAGGGRESTRMMGPGSVCCDSMYKLGVIGMRYEEAIVRCEPAVVRDAPDLAFMQCHT